MQLLVMINSLSIVNLMNRVIGIVCCCFILACASCGGPRTLKNSKGQSYIQLSFVEEVSITRSRGDIAVDYPAHAILLTEEQTLLMALQKLYPDYWISELVSLPQGSFDVAIIPRDGIIIKRKEQRQLLVRALESSFKVNIVINKDDKIATIKGRIF